MWRGFSQTCRSLSHSSKHGGGIAKCTKGPRPAQSLWRAFDWEQLCRSLPSLDSLAPRARPNQLVTVSRSLHPSNTVVVFANPALLCETLERLSNAHYIKLSGDGTFRLIQNGWVLLNLGVVTKHYAPASGRYAFRSTYHPLLFAIANKESEVTYKALFDAATFCAHHCLELDLPKLVGQYHCDWHVGEEAARLNCFPASERVADFAHFIAACTRPRVPASPDETVQTYRTGFPQPCRSGPWTRVGLHILFRGCMSCVPVLLPCFFIQLWNAWSKVCGI